jgi:hypothetical protein
LARRCPALLEKERPSQQPPLPHHRSGPSLLVLLRFVVSAAMSLLVMFGLVVPKLIVAS